MKAADWKLASAMKNALKRVGGVPFNGLQHVFYTSL